MTVKCRAGEVTGCPVTVPKPHIEALSGRQPDPGHCGTAPLITEPRRLISLAAGLPPLVHRPQGHDERSTTFVHRSTRRLCSASG